MGILDEYMCIVMIVSCRILHEYMCIVMIVYRRIILKIRNVSDKICRQTQNTHFIFGNFFPKIVLFMR